MSMKLAVSVCIADSFSPLSRCDFIIALSNARPWPTYSSNCVRGLPEFQPDAVTSELSPSLCVHVNGCVDFGLRCDGRTLSPHRL